jgi:hypothetical protein
MNEHRSRHQRSNNLVFPRVAICRLSLYQTTSNTASPESRAPKSKSKSRPRRLEKKNSLLPSLLLSVTVPELTKFAPAQYVLRLTAPTCVACVVRSLCSQENQCCNYASDSTAPHPLRPLRRSRTTELDRIESRDGKRGKKENIKALHRHTFHVSSGS